MNDHPADPVDLAFDRLSRFWSEFEPREPQIVMARAAYDTLRNGGRLAVEAPTGVGKSIAYLAASILLANSHRLRVVISTHTKNLQQQIVTRDGPRVRDVLAPEMSISLLKGRTNYLCRRRWERRLQRELIPDAHGAFLDRLAEWADQTQSGDLEEFGARNGAEWSWLSQLAAPRDSETGLLCARAPRCFLRDSRRRAAQSSIVVVNHALLLSHHLTKATVLPEYDILIVDEAHTLADVATRTLERRASPARLRAALARLGGRADLRLWERVRKLLRSRRAPGLESAETALASMLEPLARARRVGETFFRSCREELGGNVRRFQRQDAEGAFFPASLDSFVESLGSVLEHAQAVRGALSGILPADEGEEETLLDFDVAMGDAADFLETLRFTVEMPDGDYVYWFEPEPEPALVAVPLDPGRDLAGRLFSETGRLVLTSATLSVGGDFGPFVERIGLTRDEVEGVETGQAYALSEQVLVLAPPVPEPRDPRFAGAVTESVAALVRRVQRKSLVLFTSHALLRDVHRRLKTELAGEPITVLGQGVDGQRERVTRDFRRAPRAVLLGTSSFWEGVDFPGEELELLVITRLPFPVPSDPLVEARCETIEARGGSSFSRLMIPEAVLRFRQGFGRLIRRRTDRGVFVILDPRVRTARYGARFTGAIPVPVTQTPTLESAVEHALEWFATTARVQSDD